MRLSQFLAVFALFLVSLIGTAAQTAEVVVEENITYVSSDAPPVLTLHGDQDALVSVAQAVLLDEKMTAAGAAHTLKVFEGQGHGFGGDHQQDAMKAMWDFFDKHLRK